MPNPLGFFVPNEDLTFVLFVLHVAPVVSVAGKEPVDLRVKAAMPRIWEIQSLVADCFGIPTTIHEAVQLAKRLVQVGIQQVGSTPCMDSDEMSACVTAVQDWLLELDVARLEKVMQRTVAPA